MGEFDPRERTLAYASAVERISRTRLDDDLEAAIANAVGYGLVYVGDQIARLVDRRTPTEMLYERALRGIAGHEEHMGSGPADDEMRTIAIQALKRAGRGEMN